MELLLILGGGGLIALLWQRLDRIEQRLERSERQLEDALDQLHQLRGSKILPGSPAGTAAEPDTQPAIPLDAEPISLAHHRETAPGPEDIAATGGEGSSEAIAAAAALDRADASDSSDASDPSEIPDQPEPPAQGQRFRLDFEDIFGRRLPIWAGGVALAIAGVFAVRYSIESGLLSPLVRVVMAALCGLVMLAAAEFAHRLDHRIADPRVRQALAGAGLATLYAAFYLAGSQYDLVGQTVAFLGLAGVTAAAIALSFRFGLPSAILGLVGGFAAPALVGGEEANLPLLSLYLGLITAGLVLSGQRQQRPWLGAGALVGGLAWGGLLLLSGDWQVADILALGLYLIVLGAVLPALAAGRRWVIALRLGSALVASIQLAVLVGVGGYEPLVWGLYGLMAGALAALGWNRPDLRIASSIAAVLAITLLIRWPDAHEQLFAVVAIAFTAIFGCVPLALIWRAEQRAGDVLQASAFPLAIGAVAYVRLGAAGEDLLEPGFAAVMAGLATLPLAGAWKSSRVHPAWQMTILTASGAALALMALLLVTPAWLAPVAGAAVFAALFAALHRRSGRGAAVLLWCAAIITALSLLGGPLIGDEGSAAFGRSELADWRAMLRWVAAAGCFAALAWPATLRHSRALAEVFAAVFAYVALAQMLPAQSLAWTAALLAIVTWYFQRERSALQWSFAVLAGLWAIPVLSVWSKENLEALAGLPAIVSQLPDLRDVGLYVLPVAVALALLRGPERVAPHSRWLAAPVLLVALHVAMKQIFAIDGMARFIEMGLAERSLWQALLLGTAWLAARGLPFIGSSRKGAIALALLTLGHFALFSMVLHNPLFSQQAVGAVAVANLALVSYAIAIAAVLSLRVWLPALWRPACDGAVIVLTCFAAMTLLRQIFAGSVLVDTPMGQTEDLLRSVIGIVLAIGFLVLGARLGERSWRVGSLAVMLIAVGKVFIFDAAELEGLLRIASFLSLGLSLIGIGWLYSRQLRSNTKPAEPQVASQ